MIENSQTNVLQKRHEFTETALACAIYFDLVRRAVAGSAHIDRFAAASRHGFKSKDVAHGKARRNE